MLMSGLDYEVISSSLTHAMYIYMLYSYISFPSLVNMPAFGVGGRSRWVDAGGTRSRCRLCCECKWGKIF